MKSNKVVIGVLSALLSGGSIAGTMGSIAPASWMQVMTLSAGVAWANSNDTQTFYLNPEVEKTYSADKNTSALFSGELFYGFQLN